MGNVVAARSHEDADYILGHDYEFPMESKQFESRSIVFEAKRPISFEAGLGQSASYMGPCSAYLFVTESNSSTVGIPPAGESDQPEEIISRKNLRCCVQWS